MKISVLLSLVLVLTLGSPSTATEISQTQKYMISGKIEDAEGNKAVGAALLLKRTTLGSVTDTDGFFSINVPAKEATLRITHFSTSEAWEDSFEAGKEYVVRLAPDTIPNPISVFDRVEENPRPASGDDGWNVYLAKNMRYPLNDRNKGVEGTVIIGLEIHADGSVQNVEVLRGIGGESDQEAVRVISSGPNWQPGKIGGEAVNTRLSIAVQFKLSGYPTSDALAQSREAAIANLYGKERLVVIGYAPTSSR
jgi:TonB family protein